MADIEPIEKHIIATPKTQEDPAAREMEPLLANLDDIKIRYDVLVKIRPKMLELVNIAPGKGHHWLAQLDTALESLGKQFNDTQKIVWAALDERSRVAVRANVIECGRGCNRGSDSEFKHVDEYAACSDGTSCFDTDYSSQINHMELCKIRNDSQGLPNCCNFDIATTIGHSMCDSYSESPDADIDEEFDNEASTDGEFAEIDSKMSQVRLALSRRVVDDETVDDGVIKDDDHGSPVCAAH